MRLIAVGRLGNGAEAELFARYNARLRPPLAVTEIAEVRGAPPEIKRREAAALLQALPAGALAVMLDLGGKSLSSEAFAESLGAWLTGGKPLVFVIGGAEGLHADVLSRAAYVLSLGAMTWPHKLVRVMLAEQIFRARAIAANHPYHRAARP